MKEKLYVQCVMMCDSETWVMKVEDAYHLKSVDKIIFCGLSEVIFKERKASEKLGQRFGVVRVIERSRQGRSRMLDIGSGKMGLTGCQHVYGSRTES